MTLDALTDEALRAISPDKQALDLTRALTDLYRMSRALAARERGGRYPACELARLSAVDASAAGECVLLEGRAPANDERVEQREFARPEGRARPRAPASSTARSWSSPATSERLCARRASFFIDFGPAGLSTWAACHRSFARLRSSCIDSVLASSAAVRWARRPRR